MKFYRLSPGGKYIGRDYLFTGQLAMGPPKFKTATLLEIFMVLAMGAQWQVAEKMMAVQVFTHVWVFWKIKLFNLLRRETDGLSIVLNLKILKMPGIYHRTRRRNIHKDQDKW